MQFQQETRTSIQNLEKQISLLASSMVELVKQRSQEIPSQTMINTKEIASDTQLEDESEIQKNSRMRKNLRWIYFFKIMKLQFQRRALRHLR